MNTQQIGVINLIHSALTGKKYDLPADFDFVSVYKYAKSHRIIPLVYYGIVNCGIKLDQQLNDSFFFEVCQSMAVSQKQNHSLSRLSAEFEKNGIDFMPLKGSIIKDLYPKAEMRTMGDADIIFRMEQYEKIMPILEGMGLKFVKENENELAWEDAPFYLELHRYLVSPQHEDYFKYFGDGWRFAELAKGSEHRYVMNDEDYYIYLFAHLTKHYRFSGIGIKHLVDIWVYLNAKTNLDMNYIEQEFKKLKMYEFHKNVVRTVKCWFDGEPSDEVIDTITDKVFGSGAFGTSASTKAAAAAKTLENSKVKNVKFNFFLRSAFPSYKNMCIIFPVLKKVPVLLPFMWIWRLIYAVLFKRKNVKNQYENIGKASNDEALEYKKQLEAVGLDYDFGK